MPKPVQPAAPTWHVARDNVGTFYKFPVRRRRRQDNTLEYIHLITLAWNLRVIEWERLIQVR